MIADEITAAYQVRPPPAGGESPLVFDSPHSGIEYPVDFTPVASRRDILTTWDAYVDELFSGVTAAGATLVAARFPRAYIDANRAGNDIDPALLAAPWPEPLQASEHLARGMGLIRRLALPGVPMYAAPLRVADVQRRIAQYYRPYRDALQRTLDAVHDRHGFVWHFNCHSMKSRGNAMNRDAGAARPDFVIGDREGTTAPPEFTAWVAGYFSRLGHSVAVNDPYRGADIVRTHGDPARHRFSVQVEINRALYMDEATCERSAGFAPLQRTLVGFAAALAERARTAAGRGGA